MVNVRAGGCARHNWRSANVKVNVVGSPWLLHMCLPCALGWLYDGRENFYIVDILMEGP